jgi:hypothetical protein
MENTELDKEVLPVLEYSQELPAYCRNVSNIVCETTFVNQLQYSTQLILNKRNCLGDRGIPQM